MRILNKRNVITVMVVYAAFIGGILIGSANTDSAAGTVQAICDKAHREISGASEQACGSAQDVTHTEYLCDSIGFAAHCWVEAK